MSVHFNFKYTTVSGNKQLLYYKVVFCVVKRLVLPVYTTYVSQEIINFWVIRCSSIYHRLCIGIKYIGKIINRY